jgi:RNA polymerase sigma-70 factor (ECF subfamily)
MAKLEADARHAPSGDRDWDAVYRAEGPGLVRYARKLVGAVEGDDLLQECFIRAIRSERQPTQSQEVRRWLYRIITNLALDTLRRRRRWHFFPLDHLQRAPELGGDDSATVRAALRAIPPEQAVTLVLRLHERLSRADIAAILEVSESAVKGRLVRGRLNFVAAYRRLGGCSDADSRDLITSPLN